MPASFKDPKFLRVVLIAAAALVVALIAGAVLFQDSLFRMSITPPGRFADEKAPPAPDYAKPESWALRPAQQPPGGWEAPWGSDIFFVHPTSAYASAGWNADIYNKESLERLTGRILPNHAGPFVQAGPVYAPFYRQASLYSEITPGSQGDGALLVAYDDVLRAFDHYIATDNRFRGIVLAGVGQGGLYVQRLLADRFQSSPLKERLAAAYVIDAAVRLDFAGKTVAQPLCAAPDEIHCIATWKTIVAGDDANRFRDQSPIWTADWKIAASKGHALACVNPMRWTIDTELAPRIDHRGAARATDAADIDPKISANIVSARCNNGVLEAERPSQPQLQPESGAGAQYKTPEYNLFYADIVPNVTNRMKALTAWLEDPQNGVGKPAEPLPPPLVLDSPIYRPNGVAEPAN